MKKAAIWRHYPVGDPVALVERLRDHGLLANETRPLARRRQPGRCCAMGCQAPLIPQETPSSPHPVAGVPE